MSSDSVWAVLGRGQMCPGGGLGVEIGAARLNADTDLELSFRSKGSTNLTDLHRQEARRHLALDPQHGGPQRHP